MNGKDISACLLHPKKERILNINYRLGKEYGVIAMLAEMDDGVMLWEICREPEKEQENILHLSMKAKTNRELVKRDFYRQEKPFIRYLRIGETTLSISSAMGSCIGEECNVQEKVALIDMIARGVKLGELEEEPLERLRMNRYCLQEKEMPDIAPESGSDISLTFPVRHIPVRVNKRMKLRTGIYKKPRVIKIDGEEAVTVYIHGVRMYDIWEEARTQFEDGRYKDRFTEEELIKIKEQYMESLPSVCPKGSVIPLVEYECDKGYQMQFYNMEYLRRKPENRGTAVLMNVRSDEETGPMGFKKRLRPLEAVEQGYEGSIDVELFLYYRQLPEETVKCSIL